jgi:hypothetical protein
VKQIWDTIWAFALVHWTPILAAAAFVVSVASAVISHLNMRAARSQAESTKTAANAALEQSRAAEMASSLARDVSEVQALEAAKARIDQETPRVVVAVDLLSGHPAITGGWPQDIPPPHPDITPQGERTLDYVEHHNDFIYFVLRGTLYNEGKYVARVRTNGPILYSDTDPHTGLEVQIPQKSGIDGYYLLHPGQKAMFEVRPGNTIWNILNRKEKTGSDIILSRDSFLFRPGSFDEPSSVAILITEIRDPIRERTGNPDAPLVIKDHCHVEVSVERRQEYPKSFDYVHAELKGDQERLERLQLNDELRRALSSRSDEE